MGDRIDLILERQREHGEQLSLLDERLDSLSLSVEHRMTRLETRVGLLGMIGGAVSTILTALAGAIFWFLRYG